MQVSVNCSYLKMEDATHSKYRDGVKEFSLK